MEDPPSLCLSFCPQVLGAEPWLGSWSSPGASFGELPAQCPVPQVLVSPCTRWVPAPSGHAAIRNCFRARELHYFRTRGKELKSSLMEPWHSWLFSEVLHSVEITFRVAQHQSRLGLSDEGVGYQLSTAARERAPAGSEAESNSPCRQTACIFFPSCICTVVG